MKPVPLLGLVISSALAACGGNNDSGLGDGGVGDDGDGGSTPNDEIIVEKGDTLGEVTVDQIASYGFDDIGNVFYSAWLLDSGGQTLGLGIGRWTPTSHEIILTPTEIEGVLGEPPVRISFDESGFAHVQSANCLGVYGGVFNEVSCESPSYHAVAGGTMVQYYKPSGLPWEIRSGDDTGGFETLLVQGDASAAGSFQSISTLQKATVNRNGSIFFEGGGTGASEPTAQGIFRIVDGVASPWVHIAWGNTIVGNFPGTAEVGMQPSGAKYPVSNQNDELAFLWTVRDGSPDGVLGGAGIYSTSAANTAFQTHVDFTLNFPSAGIPADFDNAAKRPNFLFSLSKDRKVTVALTLADGRVGIWREDAAGSLETVVLPGDPAYDLTGEAESSITIAKVGSFIAADNGAFVFAALVEGDGVAEGDEYRLFGVTAPPNLRIGRIAMTGEFWNMEGAPNVRSIGLHGGAFSLPDTRAAGPVGFYPVMEQGVLGNSRAAWGSEGYGQSVRGEGCGEVLLLLENGRSQILEKRLLDPDCVSL